MNELYHYCVYVCVCGFSVALAIVVFLEKMMSCDWRVIERMSQRQAMTLQ